MIVNTWYNWIICLSEFDFAFNWNLKILKQLKQSKQLKRNAKNKKNFMIRSFKNKLWKKKIRSLHDFLNDFKLKYDFQLKWNKLYEIISFNDHVMQFVWKNNNVILFMNTVIDSNVIVIRKRHRFAITFTNVKISWIVFDDNHVFELIISKFIDFYNQFMNDVNIANQLRNYYDIQKIHMKNWKTLWHFLLNTIIINVYKMIYCTSNNFHICDNKRNNHKNFKIALIVELFVRSKKSQISFSFFSLSMIEKMM